MNKIVVVGSSNIDLVMKVSRLPERGETVTDGEFMQYFGGKGANQAVAAARAGGEVAFVSCVGDDAYTPEMVRNYTADNIDTRFVFQDQGIASGHALIMIGDGGMNYISVAPGANHRLTRTRVAEALPVIEEAGMVLLQNEVPEAAREHAIDLARERDIPVLWNFAPARDSNPAYLSRVTHLCVNEIEAGALAGIPIDSIEDAEEAADILVEKGVERVVLTLGDQGALFAGPREKLQVPSVDRLGLPAESLPRDWHLDKYQVPVENFCAETLPVHAIYDLDVHQEPDIRVDPVGGGQRFAIVINNTYRYGFLETLGLRQIHFQAAARLATAVDVNRITRPESPFLIDQLVDRLQEELGEPVTSMQKQEVG